MLLLIIILFLLDSYFSVLFWGPFVLLFMPLLIIVLFFCFYVRFLVLRVRYCICCGSSRCCPTYWLLQWSCFIVGASLLGMTVVLSLCVMLLILVFLFCLMPIVADCCYLLPSLYCQLNILYSRPMCRPTNVNVGFHCFLFYLFVKTQKKAQRLQAIQECHAWCFSLIFCTPFFDSPNYFCFLWCFILFFSSDLLNIIYVCFG